MPECPNCGQVYTPEWQAAVKEKDKHEKLVQLGLEILGDTSTMVCVTHKRFIPCRKGKWYKPDADQCVLSENPEDIGYVTRHQRGEVD